MLKVLFLYVFSRDCLRSLFSVGEDSLLWRVSSHSGLQDVGNPKGGFVVPASVEPLWFIM